MTSTFLDTFPYLEAQRFLPDYKNPCWRERAPSHDIQAAAGGAEGKLKCMPYFQILGVSKCGTTDLYHRLTFNPDMVDCGWKVRAVGVDLAAGPLSSHAGPLDLANAWVHVQPLPLAGWDGTVSSPLIAHLG